MVITSDQAMKLADEKYKLARAIAAALSKADTLRSELTTFRAKTLAAITSETKPDGKPLFSNDTARQAELALREEADGHVGWHARNIDTFRAEVEQLRIQHQYASDRLSIMLAFAPVLQGELLTTD